MATALQAQTRTAQLNLAANAIREEAADIRVSAEGTLYACEDPLIIALAEQAVHHASRAADRCRSNPELAQAHLFLANKANAAMVEASQDIQTPALPTTALQAVELLRRCDFREFTAADWAAYAGCESRDPRIAYLGEMTVVLDGATCGFMIDHERAPLEHTSWSLS
jgi:hypothetical protein